MNSSAFYIIGGISWRVSMAIRSWLKSAYKKWGSIRNSHGLTGALSVSLRAGACLQ